MGLFVVNVAAVALALEAARRVHAHAVLAHLRHQDALVDLFGDASHRIDDRAGTISAQSCIFAWQYGIKIVIRFNLNGLYLIGLDLMELDWIGFDLMRLVGYFMGLDLIGMDWILFYWI